MKFFGYAWKVSSCLGVDNLGVEESLLRSGGSLEVDDRVRGSPSEMVL